MKADPPSIKGESTYENKVERRGEAKTPPPPPQNDSVALPPEAQAWNEQPGLKPVRALHDKRRKALKARQKDPFFVANWQEAITKVGQSRFCTGNNDRGWAADFDWFLRPGTVVSIMEGKYDDQQPRASLTSEEIAASWMKQ